MAGTQSIENSQALCKKAKEYFASKNLPDCVIEISEKQFEDWVTHLTPTEELMSIKRREFTLDDKPFISIYADKNCTHFFFTDANLVYLEVLETREILIFIDATTCQNELEEIRKEFVELKQMLQGA